MSVGSGLDPGFGGGAREGPTGAREEIPGATEGIQSEDGEDSPAAAAAGTRTAGHSRDAGAVQGEARPSQFM